MSTKEDATTMIQPRQSAALLMTGVLLPLLVLVMHPSGHDLVHDPDGRMRAVNTLVHGIAIACLPLLATGLAGLCAWLRWSATASLAFAFYLLSSACNLVAAMMSGFVAPRLLSGGATPDASLLHFTHDINQAFATCAVVAAGTAFVLWGLALHRRGKTWLAALGVVIGILQVAGILSGLLQLDVKGILLATALQAAWLLPLAWTLRHASKE
jgi:hypothetical protein